jgi:DNA-binding transcriptional ArsR family regulator
MAVKSQDETVALAETFRALGHPLRLRVLRLAREGVKLSASKLEPSLPDETLGTISYHVRTLSGAGLLRKAGQVPHRGAVEQLYLLSPRGLRVQSAVEKLTGVV